MGCRSIFTYGRPQRMILWPRRFMRDAHCYRIAEPFDFYLWEAARWSLRLLSDCGAVRFLPLDDPQWASRINLWGQKWYPCIDDNVDNKIDIIIDVMDNNVDTNNIDIDTIDINIDININDTNNTDIYINSTNLSTFWNSIFFNFRWKLCSFQSWSK